MSTRRKKPVIATLNLSQKDVSNIVAAMEFTMAALLEQQMMAIMAALGYRRSDNKREGAKVQ